MKKTLLLAAVLATSVAATQAQTFTNAGLETWQNLSVGSLSLTRPDSWYGVDSLIAGVAPLAALGGIQIDPVQQLFKSNQSHSGSFSAEIKSAFVGQDLGNVPGVLSNAQIGIDIAGAMGADPSDILDFVTYTGGTAITAKVDTVSAWVLLGDNNMDSAMITVNAVKVLTGSEGDSTVVLGTGSYKIAPGLNEFTKVSVPLTYLNAEIPEKLIVAFLSSSIDADSVHAGNTLLVDDVAFSYMSGQVSVRQPLMAESKMLVYPNPARNTIYFNLNAVEKAEDYTLTVVDVSGRTILTEGLTRQVNEKNVSQWIKGHYFYTLANVKNGNVVQGKFSVQ